MSVKERMYEAAKATGLCESCAGRITISRSDFDEVASLPTREAQFERLKQYAAQGAAAKCNGCSVVVSGHYESSTLVGMISCVGASTNG